MGCLNEGKVKFSICSCSCIFGGFFLTRQTWTNAGEETREERWEQDMGSLFPTLNHPPNNSFSQSVDNLPRNFPGWMPLDTGVHNSLHQNPTLLQTLVSCFLWNNYGGYMSSSGVSEKCNSETWVFYPNSLILNPLKCRSGTYPQSHRIVLNQWNWVAIMQHCFALCPVSSSCLLIHIKKFQRKISIPGRLSAMIFVHGALDIQDSSLHTMVGSLPTPVQLYQDAVKFNTLTKSWNNIIMIICFCKRDGGFTITALTWDLQTSHRLSWELEIPIHTQEKPGAQIDVLWSLGRAPHAYLRASSCSAHLITEVLNRNAIRNLASCSVRPNLDIRFRKDGLITEI